MTDKTDAAYPTPEGKDSLHYTVSPSPGLTAQEHAAIELRVPNSGTDWLDEMITKAVRLDAVCGTIPVCQTLSSAFIQADAMIDELTKDRP